MILHSQGKVPPTLRFYRWHPPCLSVGYFQSVQKEVELDRCHEMRIGLVRRPTGGRAILHEDELTYSLVISEVSPQASGGICESYRKLSQGILQGLHLLGVQAQAERRIGRNGHEPRSGACFDSTSRYEITVKGRKLVGSAQVRRQGSILQQGTVPLSIDGERLFSLLKAPDEIRRRAMVDSFCKGVTSLKQVLGAEVGWEEVTKAIKRGFEQGLGVRLILGQLTPEEEELARWLVKHKYVTEEWNFRR